HDELESNFVVATQAVSSPPVTNADKQIMLDNVRARGPIIRPISANHKTSFRIGATQHLSASGEGERRRHDVSKRLDVTLFHCVGNNATRPEFDTKLQWIYWRFGDRPKRRRDSGRPVDTEIGEDRGGDEIYCRSGWTVPLWKLATGCLRIAGDRQRISRIRPKGDHG